MTEKVYKQLTSMGVMPNKELGQNFLIDPFVVTQIVDFANPKSDEKLVEIGPGLGALTTELMGVSNLTVIEIEEKFCEKLKEEYPEINIINEDVRCVDFSEIGDDLVIFGNLPYCFSTDITFQLLEFSSNVKRAIIMLQKEFAERLAAKPNTKKYGTLSVLTQLKAETRLGPIFPGDSFHPPAKIESQMIELKFYNPPKYVLKNDLRFKEILQITFQQRRKKISNTLSKIVECSAEELKEKLKEINVNPDARPENLSVEEFIILSENI